MKLAVVGGGIAGLGAAWLLRDRHQVTLFERDHRLGGHAHTVTHLTHDGRRVPLDTGFLVYNQTTYPLLTRLFDRLGVATQTSEMSFGVSCARPDVEYAVRTLGSLLAQPTNLLRPSFARMLADIVRFGRRGRSVLATAPDPAATVAGFLRAEGFGRDFERLYLRPMVAAIWSTGTSGCDVFPRDALLRFFANHGLLQVAGRPVWRTVTGGSRSYVQRLADDLPWRLRIGCGVAAIQRRPQEVVLHLENGACERFDHVVIAAHADQALAMLAEPSDAERELLGAWRYSENQTWLHTDRRLMPRRRSAWAAWNYLLEERDSAAPAVSVSYHLNRLQSIEDETDYVVTLNPRRPPDPATVLRRLDYRHPVFDHASVASQAELTRLNGANRTHFCGAWLRHGFHEDGLWSAANVAADLGVGFP